MSEDTLVLNHRQLLSGLISLVIGHDHGTDPILGSLGYVLNGLEIPMVDAAGSRFVPDIHLVSDSVNLSLLVEGKSGPASIDEQQTACYLNMQGIEVLRQGRLTVAVPQSHRVDAVFFVVESAESQMRSIVENILQTGPMKTSGMGLIRIAPLKTYILLGSLSDSQLDGSLRNGWNLRFADLPLERLPYEPSSPGWELAQSLLQTLAAYFLEERGAFDTDDVCRDSNELWPYLSDQHDHIRNRVRKMLVSLRGTAFRGWIKRLPGTTQLESRWEFIDRSVDRSTVQLAFQRRATKYIELVKNSQQPRPEDFDDVDQLPLPLVLDVDAPGSFSSITDD